MNVDLSENQPINFQMSEDEIKKLIRSYKIYSTTETLIVSVVLKSGFNIQDHLPIADTSKAAKQKLRQDLKERVYKKIIECELYAHLKENPGIIEKMTGVIKSTITYIPPSP